MGPFHTPSTLTFVLEYYSDPYLVERFEILRFERSVCRIAKFLISCHDYHERHLLVNNLVS